MSAALPTPQDCAELLAFLPRFQEPGFRAVVGSDYRVDAATGQKFWIGPRYHPSVAEFFHVLGATPCWFDREYDRGRCGALLQDPDAIASADLTTLRSLLTACQRAERFGEGAWGAAVDQGYIAALLTRLQALARDA
ncbi:DUF6508 domain-containing protein [Lysobacter enzymogenes]|uniref:DUF6508 domain-containing protein n=1 Tax=Lysobacter enzymogenes TaxID=69 RepID=UPI001A96ED45|nr:DUF6508 domain-containing protein [Lysobacter enzymogenes]QQP97464.1 hypothetical protein JHW38_05425 [Lysobacter enzymogenes]